MSFFTLEHYQLSRSCEKSQFVVSLKARLADEDFFVVFYHWIQSSLLYESEKLVDMCSLFLHLSHKVHVDLTKVK